MSEEWRQFQDSRSYPAKITRFHEKTAEIRELFCIRVSLSEQLVKKKKEGKKKGHEARCFRSHVAAGTIGTEPTFNFQTAAHDGCTEHFGIASLRNHRVVEHQVLFILARMHAREREERVLSHTHTHTHDHGTRPRKRELQVFEGLFWSGPKRSRALASVCRFVCHGASRLPYVEGKYTCTSWHARANSYRLTTWVYALTHEYAEITRTKLSYRLQFAILFGKISFEESLERLSRLYIPRTSITADAHWTVNLNF